MATVLNNFRPELLWYLLNYDIKPENTPHPMNTEVNSKAKAYATDSTIINAPVEKVFSLIYGIREWPEWRDGVTAVDINSEPAEGSTFTWKADGYTIKSAIHTVRPYSEIGWTGKIWWIKAVHNWQFDRLPDGNTRVTVSESFSGLGASLMKNTLVNTLRKDLQALKDKSER